MTRNPTAIVIAVAAVIVIILGAVFTLLIRELDGSDQPTLTAGGTSVAIPTGPATRAVATRAAELPPPAITILPTSTPRPSDTPTATPEATATPEPTATLPPTAIPPTSAPVVPTATTAPPTATAAPGANTQGIVATHFALQPRSVFQVAQPVWFEFNLANNAGGPVSFGSLGVMPRKDGADRLAWYQQSWGGNNDAVPANGLSWEDHIDLPESGSMTLRLVICFDGTQACLSGQGTFHTLSAEIPVTISP